MAVIRVNKTNDYTVMSNYHLKDKRLTLKAKGLLSLFLSLPDNWNYTVGGLVAICLESERAVKSALNELKKYGYLRIDKIKPTKENGGRYEYIYNIFEQPQGQRETEKQEVQKQGVQNQPLENSPLYKDTNKLNKNNNIIDENFEKLWKLLPSNKNDRKSKVTKKRKKELFEMGESAVKAISLYLNTQNSSYYHARHNILNELIDNYIDNEMPTNKNNNGGNHTYGVEEGYTNGYRRDGNTESSSNAKRGWQAF